MSPAALRFAPAIVLALTPALPGCTTGGGSTSEAGTTAGSSSTSTTGVLAEIPAPADFCAETVLVSQGLYQGSLRDAGPDEGIGGVCGKGGPDTFLRVEVAGRADLRVEARGVGFAPRLSLAPDDCLGGREIACAADAPLELRDVAGGTVLRVSVGVDPDVFSDLNKKPAPDGAPDPLQFALDVGLTRVLDAGDICEPQSRGRCVDGTLCTAGGDGSTRVCTALPADTCSAALRTPVALDAGSGSLAVDPAAPQTDAHHHSCGGDGSRERVLRLALPPAPPGRALEIVAARPDVGLAVRTPSCLADDEVACAAGSASPARVVIGDVAGLHAAGVEPYLFIELPDGSEQDPPFDLALRLVAEPATWGAPGG